MRLYLLILLLACAGANASDEDAIALAAFDYMQGWYSGNAAQMERSLHPDLAKRNITVDKHGRARVEHMGAMRLVQLTRAGVGTRTPKDQQTKEIIILDVHGDTASVKAIMHGWIDYLHLVRIDGRWLIVNVLWDLKDGGSL